MSKSISPTTIVLNPKEYIMTNFPFEGEQSFTFNDITSKINNGKMVAFIMSPDAGVTIVIGYLRSAGANLTGNYPYQITVVIGGDLFVFGAANADVPMELVNDHAEEPQM